LRNHLDARVIPRAGRADLLDMRVFLVGPIALDSPGDRCCQEAPGMSFIDVCLVRSRGSSREPVLRFGVKLLDDYLDFVASRCRPNTVLATAYDLRVFFAVVGRPVEEVTSRDVLAFMTAQRSGRPAIAGLGRPLLQPVTGEEEVAALVKTHEQGMIKWAGCVAAAGNDASKRATCPKPLPPGLAKKLARRQPKPGNGNQVGRPGPGRATSARASSAGSMIRVFFAACGALPEPRMPGDLPLGPLLRTVPRSTYAEPQNR